MTCVHYYIATAETSAVTSVEEESHEDSTAMIAPTSDMSSRDEGTGKQFCSQTTRCYILSCGLRAAPVSVLDRKSLSQI